MDAEAQIQRAHFKVICRFSPVWWVSSPNPYVVWGSTVLSRECCHLLVELVMIAESPLLDPETERARPSPNHRVSSGHVGGWTCLFLPWSLGQVTQKSPRESVLVPKHYTLKMGTSKPVKFLHAYFYNPLIVSMRCLANLLISLLLSCHFHTAPGVSQLNSLPDFSVMPSGPHTHTHRHTHTHTSQ